MQEIKQLTTPKNYDKFDKKITDKQFLLGRFYDATLSSVMSPACTKKHHQIKKFPKSKTQKLLQAQNKIYGALKQHKKKKKQQKDDKLEHMFQTYLPLNKLWCNYMLDLIAKQANQESRELKVLRSDFHGAAITVVHSKNPTMIGLEGIVIKETLKTFQIVVQPDIDCQKQKQNQMSIGGTYNKSMIKTVVKSLCIFLIKVSQSSTFLINGNSLVYRPSDRIKHKFKFKIAETLNHQFLGIISDIKTEEQESKQ